MRDEEKVVPGEDDLDRDGKPKHRSQHPTDPDAAQAPEAEVAPDQLKEEQKRVAAESEAPPDEPSPEPENVIGNDPNVHRR